MIRVKQKGDFGNTTRYLQRVKKGARVLNLAKFGEEGVNALKAATPVDTGLTASSWYYKIEEDTKGIYKISFCNSNVNKGVNIAIILQYGHGTRNGGWIEGRDYINPAIQPVFDKIVDSAWKEVSKS